MVCIAERLYLTTVTMTASVQVLRVLYCCWCFIPTPTPCAARLPAALHSLLLLQQQLLLLLHVALLQPHQSGIPLPGLCCMQLLSTCCLVC